MRDTAMPSPTTPKVAASNTAPVDTGAAIVQIGIRACGFILALFWQGYLKNLIGGAMKIIVRRWVSLWLSAGVMGVSLAAVDTTASTGSNASTHAGTSATAAPDAGRAQAREIFANIIGIESSIGKEKVPAVAGYLAERFK